MRIRFPSLIAWILLSASAVQAQGDLSEYFLLIRAEGPQPSDSETEKTVALVSPYIEGTKNLAQEWPTINAALTDPTQLVREKACAILAALAFVNYNSRQPLVLPAPTRELVIQRFTEPLANLRENAVRAIALIAGGAPPSVQPQLLQMARTDPENKVRKIAIAALAIVDPTPEITNFWIEILNDSSNTVMRGMVLSSFRSRGPTDRTVVALVIDALRDSDRFIRQEAIAAVIQIGKPAQAAIPLLMEIRDGQGNDETLQRNAASAIRILSDSSGK